MNDITKLLGLPVQYTASPQKDRLPRYLTEAYELQAAQVGSVPVLFLFPKAGLASTQTLEKHIKRLEQLCHASAVLVLPSVSRYRRNALVEAHLPFVVPDHQVYLPFLGASLLERFSPEIPVPLAPASQQMFLWYLYEKKEGTVFIRSRPRPSLFGHDHFQGGSADGGNRNFLRGKKRRSENPVQ